MGIAPSSSPYGLYSAVAVPNYERERVGTQKWKKSRLSWFGSGWEWVGTGKPEPCGSVSTFRIASYNHGQPSGYTYTYDFEGPDCPKGGGKKRKPSKKTRKASRR